MLETRNDDLFVHYGMCTHLKNKFAGIIILFLLAINALVRSDEN